MITSVTRRRQNGGGCRHDRRPAGGGRREAEKIRVLPVLGIRLGIYAEINNR